MQTLYQAANAVEAHMILHMLKQQGIHGHVLGEHLQGAVGELPAAGLVRVTVEEVDYARGRELIAEWEAAIPQDEVEAVPGPAARRGKPWAMLLLGLAIGVAGTYAAYRVPAREQTMDHDGNGVPDETWTASLNGTPIAYEADRNFDGKPDYVMQLARGGVMTEARADEDFDGVMETRITFLHNQHATIETDTDGDGYPDYVSVYKHGVIEEIRFVSPITGQPQRVEHLRLGKLSYADVDADLDGTLDTRWLYGPQGEIRVRERLSEGTL